MAKNTIPIPDEPPRSYFGAARSYVLFVSIGQMQTPRIEDKPFHLALPKRLLLGFAMELYLKAWLRKQGVSTRDLQFKPYGHDVGSMMKISLEKGLKITPQIQDVARQLARQHKSHGNRYVVKEDYFLDMDYRYVIWALCVLDEIIAPEIGIADCHGIDIGNLPH